MMQIEIHDVGHGHCAVVTAPDGTRLMLDCGSDAAKGWWPSIHYGGRHIDLLVIQNLDEDHVQDLPDMWAGVSLGGIFSNPTVSAAALQRMKARDGMRRGVEFAHKLIRAFQPGVVHGQLPLSKGAGVEAWSAWNRYGIDFGDTNNLSLATFIRYGNFTALFTGDLEKAGWLKLLENPAFKGALATVDVLVASHHGRENGCSEEAFGLLHPQIVVFSDHDIRYGTQDTIGWYRQRVKGIPDLRGKFDPWMGYPKRKVLTTRRDGHIRLDVQPSGNFLVTTERDAGRHYALPALNTIGLGSRLLDLNALAIGLGSR